MFDSNLCNRITDIGLPAQDRRQYLLVMTPPNLNCSFWYQSISSEFKTCFELTNHNLCNNSNTCESAQVHSCYAATEKKLLNLMLFYSGPDDTIATGKALFIMAGRRNRSKTRNEIRDHGRRACMLCASLFEKA